MDFWNGLIAGLIAGWLIEWIIDWYMWRRDKEKLEAQVTAANAEISRLQSELAAFSPSDQLTRQNEDQLEYTPNNNQARVSIGEASCSTKKSEGVLEKNTS